MTEGLTIVPADIADVDYTYFRIMKGIENKELQDRFIDAFSKYKLNKNNFYMHAGTDEKGSNAYYFSAHSIKKGNHENETTFFEMLFTDEKIEMKEKDMREGTCSHILIQSLEDNVIKVVVRNTSYKNELKTSYRESLYEHNHLIYHKEEDIIRSLDIYTEDDRINTKEIYIDNQYQQAVSKVFVEDIENGNSTYYEEYESFKPVLYKQKSNENVNLESVNNSHYVGIQQYCDGVLEAQKNNEYLKKYTVK